jgi:hypothetical protein
MDSAQAKTKRLPARKLTWPVLGFVLVASTLIMASPPHGMPEWLWWANKIAALAYAAAVLAHAIWRWRAGR